MKELEENKELIVTLTQELRKLAAEMKKVNDKAEEDSGFGAVDFLDLDEAMDRLEQRNGRWFSVVMHKYYAGRAVPEIADLMGVSVETVKNDWKLARAWLLRELERRDPR